MLKNILTDISNPRLDILIIYKENNSIADELFMKAFRYRIDQEDLSS